ncbi:MFS transporter [Nocardia sp. bgisy134]|uniref:MFS transporter n=1 Tax=Nocardia sp. bgisy134 TaxID=3413789 RepID=UPI003D72AAC8
MSATRRANRVLALLMLFMMINFADKAVLGLTADPIMNELGLSATGFGMVAAGFYLLFSASAVLVGFLGNRVPVRLLLAILVFIWSVAQLPILVPGTGFAILLGTRVLLGAGEGPGFPLANHTAFTWFPEQRRALPSAVITAGGALGAVLGGPLIIVTISALGWRAAFGLLGILGLLWLSAWLRWGNTGPYHVGGNADSSTQKEVPFLRIVATGTWLGGTFATFTVMWSLALGLAWLPLYLADEVGFSEAAVGGLIGLPSVVAIALVLTVGVIAQRAARRGASRRLAHGVLGGAVAALAGICMLAVTRLDVAPLVLLVVVIAFSAGNAQTPLVNAAIADICPDRQRSAALGTSYAVAAVASLLAPYVTGRLIDAAPSPSVGFAMAFDLAGLLLVAGAAVSMLAIRPDRDQLRTDPAETEIGVIGRV